MISISHIYSDQPSFIYREVFSTVLFKHLDALGKEISGSHLYFKFSFCMGKESFCIVSCSLCRNLTHL